MTTIDQIKLLHKDILIRPYIERLSDVIVVENTNRQEKINLYEVVKVASDVKHVSVGDKIYIEYMDHTNTFMLDGERLAITREDSVLAIVD